MSETTNQPRRNDGTLKPKVRSAKVQRYEDSDEELIEVTQILTN